MKNKRPLHSVQTGTQVANISFDEILLCQAVSYATSVCFSSICLFQPIVDAFDTERGRIGRALLGINVLHGEVGTLDSSGKTTAILGDR